MSEPSSNPVTPRKSCVDPSTLRVVELRAELSARHLSPKGLKKDLVKRLSDALHREEAAGADEKTTRDLPPNVANDDVEGEGEEEEDKEVVGAEGNGSDGKGAEDGKAEEGIAPVDPALPSQKESSEELAESVSEVTSRMDTSEMEERVAEERTTAVRNVSEMQESNECDKRVVKAQSPSPRSPSPAKPSGAKRAIPEESGAPAETTPKKKRSFSPIKPPSPVKSSSPPQQPANITVRADTDALRREKSAATGASSMRNHPSDTLNDGVEAEGEDQNKEEPEAPPKKKRAFSPVKPPSPAKSSTPPPQPATVSAPPDSATSTRSPVKSAAQGGVFGNESANAEPLNEERGPSPPKFAESSSIFILGLHRPFTTPTLKRMLEEYGTTEYFWIDNIKSHCYVTFTDVQSAVVARSQIHGTVWPPQTGHRLTVDFITPERMQALVEEEEKEQQARRRVRVVESADPDVVLVIEDISTVRPKSAAGVDMTSNVDASRRISGGGILSRLGGLAPPLSTLTKAVADQQQYDRKQPDAGASWKSPAAPETPSRLPKASAPKHVPPDHIFQKTETKPQLYYVPLSDKQVAEKLRCREA